MRDPASYVDQQSYSNYLDVSDFEGKDHRVQRSPRRKHTKEDHRQDAEHQVHTFQKNKLNSDRSIRDRNHDKQLPPKYLEIKPYLDDILSDQITENKEVQRGLEQLKVLNERLLSDLGSSGHERQETHAKGSYWE